MEPHSDEPGWIAAAQQGDHAAFALLLEAYKLPVYNLAYRMLGNGGEAEDATQEVFLRAYLKLASYDRSRRFSTWLLAITSNYCIDVIRRRRAPVVTLEDMEFVLATDVAGPEESAVRHEQEENIARAVGSLSPGYRLPMILRYYYDLPYDEIERITGLSEPTIKTRLHRGRRMVKELLEGEGVVRWIAETSGR